VGVYDSELEAQEETFVFAGLETVQEMLGIGNRSSELAVLGLDYDDVDSLYQTVSAAADDDLDVEPWYEIDTFLGSMRTMMDGMVLIMILIFFLALAFGLVNTLVMAVFERKREIGLMLALGVAPRNIVAQVVAEAVFLIALGLLLGNLLSWATVAALADGIDISGFVPEDMGMSSRLFPSLTGKDLLMANGVVLVLGFLASISPAVRASRLEPLEALRDT
jgi:ABC-type lipoprotein release transport system permease subunit